MNFCTATKTEAWWWAGGAEAFSDAPALLTQEGCIMTRAQLHSAVNELANALIARGVQRSDRLALVMAPGSAMATALIAAMGTAGVAPLVPTHPLATLLADLRRLGATHVLVDEQPPAAILEAADQLGLPVIKLVPGNKSGAITRTTLPPQPEDIALLLQTSGTTSQPKVVPLSHGNILFSARAITNALDLRASDRSLAAMPLFHIHGIVASLLAPLLAGGSVICCESNTPTTLLNLLSTLKPTWLSAVPTLLQGLLTELDRRGASPPAHQLRLLRSSSSPLPPAVLKRLEALFEVPVLEAYGMTEAAHQICSNRLPGSGHGRIPGSVGAPAGPEVAVLDSSHELLPAGKSGEVAIRGPGVTSGYEGADQSGWINTANGDRWFLTGDEGVFDTEGRLTLTGRLKEMINRGGEKVIPRRVDEALLQHSDVEQALAFAVPHPTLGEDLAAAVVLRANALADEQALRRHAFSLLAPHEIPTQIVLLPDLPRGATGKLQRIGMAERIRSRLEPVDEPASGELEELVAHTFASILQHSEPGRNANFFMLGGDSLSGQRVVSVLEQKLVLDLSPTLLFMYPTVHGLAEQLDRLLDEAIAAAEAITCDQ
jgi:acyl-CoA synthetase (AMP-forming)/AMP-acid ligase II